MKKLISFLLAALLIFGCALSAAAQELDTEAADDTYSPDTEAAETDDNEETEDISGEADTASCGVGLSWTFIGGELTISGTGEMDAFPKGAPWKDLKSQITSVVLYDNVVNVGDYAFEDYDNLKSVRFGSSVKWIGQRAFASCDGLTSIHLPASFKRFDEEAFRGCSNLKEIHFDGTFPRFENNCLWEVSCKLYYPASAPWSTIYIEQLENAFQGRIEFLDSNGEDHFTYEEPTEAAAETEAATEEVTEATTEPVTEAPETQPTTAPTEAPTEAVTEAPTEHVTEEVTQETFFFGAEETTRPTEKPAQSRSGGGLVGAAIVVFVLSVIGIGALIFHAADRRRYR